MGIITAVEPQQKNKNRVSVFIDGEFACGLSLFTAAKFGLKAGKEICPELLSSAIKDSETGVCFDIACRLLGSRRKSEKEIEKYLLGKGFDPEVVGVAVERLKEYHYIDDIAFVKDYIATYGKKYGAKKLRFELKNKGLDEEIVDDALSSFDGATEAACKAAQKYRRTHKTADKNKMYTYLLSKGFGSEEIREAVNSIDWEENSDDYNT